MSNPAGCGEYNTKYGPVRVSPLEGYILRCWVPGDNSPHDAVATLLHRDCERVAKWKHERGATA